MSTGDRDKNEAQNNSTKSRTSGGRKNERTKENVNERKREEEKVRILGNKKNSQAGRKGSVIYAWYASFSHPNHERQKQLPSAAMIETDGNLDDPRRPWLRAG